MRPIPPDPALEEEFFREHERSSARVKASLVLSRAVAKRWISGFERNGRCWEGMTAKVPVEASTESEWE